MTQQFDSDSRLIQLLVELKTDIASIKTDIDLLKKEQSQEQNKHNSSIPRVRIRFYFSSSDLERKPIHLKVDGALSAAENLSKVRAAILFVAILDLQDRLQGEPGLKSINESAVDVFRQIEPVEKSKDHQRNSVRVALYRFNEYLNANKGFSNGDLRLYLDPQTKRLDLIDRDGSRVEDGIQLEVATSDPTLEDLRTSVLKRSVKESLDLKGAVYAQGTGSFSFDSLFNELYGHDYPLETTAVFYRPITHTYPIELMTMIKREQDHIARSQRIVDYTKTGLFKVRQVLGFDTIWNLIRCNKDGEFLMHPFGATTDHAKMHLEYMIELIKDAVGHDTVLTDVFFPFYYSTMKIDARGGTKHYTLFYRRFSEEALGEVACFALEGFATYNALSNGMTKWILEHPSTVTDQKQVIEVIESVIDHLVTKGPIVDENL